MCKSPTKSQTLQSPVPGASLEQSPPGLLFAAGTQGMAEGQPLKSCRFFAGSVPAVPSDPSHSLGEGLPGLS